MTNEISVFEMGNSRAKTFEAEVIERIARSFGLSREQVSHGVARFYVSKRVLDLCSSKDPRRVKRGVRLYRKQNGPNAPHSLLHMKVREVKSRQFNCSIWDSWILNFLGEPYSPTAHTSTPIGEAEQRKE